MLDKDIHSQLLSNDFDKIGINYTDKKIFVTGEFNDNKRNIILANYSKNDVNLQSAIDVLILCLEFAYYKDNEV